MKTVLSISGSMMIPSWRRKYCHNMMIQLLKRFATLVAFQKRMS